MGSVVLEDRETLELSSLPWSPSLAPENSLGCLYSFPNAKIWTKLHKIWKVNLSNLQSTPTVSYQNTDTCRKLPMECYYFTTERRACREADIRGQGEWKLRFNGYSNGETFKKNIYMVIVKRSQEKFQMGNICRVVVTLREDRAGHCEQEKGKGMHKGKWCGTEPTQTNIGCRMWVNGESSSSKYSYCTLAAVWTDFLYRHTLSYS